MSFLTDDMAWARYDRLQEERREREAREREASAMRAAWQAERDQSLRIAYEANDQGRAIPLLREGARINRDVFFACVSRNTEWGRLFLENCRAYCLSEFFGHAVLSSETVAINLLVAGRVSAEQLNTQFHRCVNSGNARWMEILSKYFKQPNLNVPFQESWHRFNGYFPLHIAAAIGTETMVRLLTEKMRAARIDLSIQTEGYFFGFFGRQTALDIARTRGDARIIQLLESATVAKGSELKEAVVEPEAKSQPIVERSELKEELKTIPFDFPGLQRRANKCIYPLPPSLAQDRQFGRLPMGEYKTAWDGFEQSQDQCQYQALCWIPFIKKALLKIPVFSRKYSIWLNAVVEPLIMVFFWEQ